MAQPENQTTTETTYNALVQHYKQLHKIETLTTTQIKAIAAWMFDMGYKTPKEDATILYLEGQIKAALRRAEEKFVDDVARKFYNYHTPGQPSLWGDVVEVNNDFLVRSILQRLDNFFRVAAKLARDIKTLSYHKGIDCVDREDFDLRRLLDSAVYEQNPDEIPKLGE